VFAASRYRLTATAYLPGAAAVGVEERIRSAVDIRVPDSDPAVQVELTDRVTVEFTVAAVTLPEARAAGRAVAAEVLLGAAPIALDAVELLTPPAVPV
jgi:hypothetical protein